MATTITLQPFLNTLRVVPLSEERQEAAAELLYQEVSKFTDTTNPQFNDPKIGELRKRIAEMGHPKSFKAEYCLTQSTAMLNVHERSARIKVEILAPKIKQKDPREQQKQAAQSLHDRVTAFTDTTNPKFDPKIAGFREEIERLSHSKCLEVQQLVKNSNTLLNVHESAARIQIEPPKIKQIDKGELEREAAQSLYDRVSEFTDTINPKFDPIISGFREEIERLSHSKCLEVQKLVKKSTAMLNVHETAARIKETSNSSVIDQQRVVNSNTLSQRRVIPFAD
jgi:hypothetical protein